MKTRREKKSSTYQKGIKKEGKRKRKRRIQLSHLSQRFKDKRFWLARFKMTKKTVSTSDRTIYIPIGNLALPAAIASRLQAEAQRAGNLAECVRRALIYWYGEKKDVDAEDF